jgi:hypothetical protein
LIRWYRIQVRNQLCERKIHKEVNSFKKLNCEVHTRFEYAAELVSNGWEAGQAGGHLGRLHRVQRGALQQGGQVRLYGTLQNIENGDEINAKSGDEFMNSMQIKWRCIQSKKYNVEMNSIQK